MRIRLRHAGLLLTGCALLTISGCSSGEITPGYGSPRGAVQGYIHAFDTGSLSNGSLCKWVAPADQAACRSALQQAGSEITLTVTSNTLAVKSQTISGDRALVSITGQVCAEGEGCKENMDPNSGMPGTTGSFGSAYNFAITRATDSLSPLPCTLIGGSWYISLNPFGDSETSSATDSSATTTPDTSPATTTPGTSPPTTS